MQRHSSSVREYGEIVQTNKRTWIAYQHVKMFQKVKERQKFFAMIRIFSVTKSSVIYKIKLANKYPRLMKSSLLLSFLKTYFKDIKEICKENVTEFQQLQGPHLCTISNNSMQNTVQSHIFCFKKILFCNYSFFRPSNRHFLDVTKFLNQSLISLSVIRQQFLLMHTFNSFYINQYFINKCRL